MENKIYFLAVLILSGLTFISCSSEDESIPEPEPMVEPLPQSTFSFKFDDLSFEATLDSAFLNEGNFSTQDLNASADDDSLSMGILIQQPLAEQFVATNYSFTNATDCLQLNALCASFVVSIESADGTLIGYGSRFEENTLQINFEIAEVEFGGRIKGTFSGEVSAGDNAEQHLITEGNFDLYIERE